MTRLYAYIAAALLFIALAFFVYLENGWRQDWKQRSNALTKQEQANAKQHKKELDDADTQHTADMDAMVAYYAGHPFVVRVPAPSSNLHAGSAPSAGSSPPPGVAQTVPPGDRGSPSGAAPSDVGLLYDAYAQVFSQTLIDLKEQQAVR